MTNTSAKPEFLVLAATLPTSQLRKRMQLRPVLDNDDIGSIQATTPV